MYYKTLVIDEVVAKQYLKLHEGVTTSADDNAQLVAGEIHQPLGSSGIGTGDEVVGGAPNCFTKNTNILSQNAHCFERMRSDVNLKKSSMVCPTPPHHLLHSGRQHPSFRKAHQPMMYVHKHKTHAHKWCLSTNAYTMEVGCHNLHTGISQYFMGGSIRALW